MRSEMMDNKEKQKKQVKEIDQMMDNCIKIFDRLRLMNLKKYFGRK